MWGRHCGGLGMRLTLHKARFQGARGPAALCLPGAACSPSCEAARGGGCFPAPRGWSSSLDSHGECREQLQTHKQILLQQAVGKEPGCQAACVTACGWGLDASFKEHPAEKLWGDGACCGGAGWVAVLPSGGGFAGPHSPP